jgi:hypothetical protein
MTWRAVSTGSYLAAIFEMRDGRARRAVLRRFVDTAPPKLGFAAGAYTRPLFSSM